MNSHNVEPSCRSLQLRGFMPCLPQVNRPGVNTFTTAFPVGLVMALLLTTLTRPKLQAVMRGGEPKPYQFLTVE